MKHWFRSIYSNLEFEFVLRELGMMKMRHSITFSDDYIDRIQIK